jgi:hypothetical protein
MEPSPSCEAPSQSATAEFPQSLLKFMFKRDLNWSLSWARLLQFILLDVISLRTIFILQVRHYATSRKVADLRPK